MKESVKKYLEGSPPYLQPEGFLKKRGKHKMSNELAVSEAKNTQLEKDLEDSKTDKR